MRPDKPSVKRLGTLLSLTVPLVALAALPATTEAGAVSKSVQRAIAAKMAKQSTAQAARRQASQPSAKALTTAEQAALRRQLAMLDAKTLAALERRYGVHIPRERLARAKATPTEFQDHAAYQRHVRETYPDMAKHDREAVVGDFVHNRPYVDRNQLVVPRTAAHERIHQLADPRFSAQVGKHFDEGMTEYFAARVYGDLGIRSIPPAYPDEQRLVNMMAARLGEQRLAQAYFRGNASLLRRDLDSQLGPGAFDDVTWAIHRGDHGKAEQILKYGLR